MTDIDKASMLDTLLVEIGRQVAEFCDNITSIFKQYQDLLEPAGCAVVFGIASFNETKGVMLLGNDNTKRMINNELETEINKRR